jgi:hypothetical protein
MSRREDWPERLAAHVEAGRDKVFRYGDHDCCTFAASWIREATGDDPLGDLRGAWTNEREALRLLAEESLRDRATAALGEEIAPALAQRGDIVLHDLGGREGLGICLGERFAAPIDLGITFVPMTHAVAAWRV